MTKYAPTAVTPHSHASIPLFELVDRIDLRQEEKEMFNKGTAKNHMNNAPSYSYLSIFGVFGHYVTC